MLATNEWTIRDKVCLITGGTSGIGRATALGLARQGAHVVIVGRDRERGAAAVDQIKQQSRNDQIDLVLADLSSQASIRQLADQVLERYERLHVLLNNAGAIYTQRGTSVDGIERTFALDHLAYFLLTNVLLDRIRSSAPARIINVSSDAHRMGTIRFDDLQRERRYRGFGAYGQAKLANVLFTYELARRLRGTDVTVNAVHPGTIASGFGQNNGLLFNSFFAIMRPFFKTPEQGAQTSIYLASSPDVAGVTGKYFSDCKPVRSNQESYNNEVAARLWQISAEMTGLAG